MSSFRSTVCTTASRFTSFSACAMVSVEAPRLVPVSITTQSPGSGFGSSEKSSGSGPGSEHISE
jgi:hypothetical protein